MSTTASYVFSKTAAQTEVVSADLTPLLKQGEMITQLDPQAVFPVTTPPMTVSIISGTAPVCQMMLSGGINDTSYGYKLTVTTNARIFETQMAVAVVDSPWIPYTTQSPGAYQDLVGSIEAGKAAMSSALFTFPPSEDPTGGYVTWDLLSQDGTTYASGNAFTYEIIKQGIQTIVRSNSLISVPSTVPPSMIDQRYQIRYTLELPLPVGAPPGTQVRFFSYESIEVVGFATVPWGTEPQVEMQGKPANLSLVTERLFDNVQVSIYQDNTQLAPFSDVGKPTRTANGYYYAATINTAQLAAAMTPYHVVWQYWNNDDPDTVYQLGADLWITNPSIMSAVMDMKAKINKARTTLYGKPDLLFPNTTIMTWLRRGMDAFNAGYGIFTSFTMTNAKGPIREFWLLCSEVSAIESQYLAEGEKAFDFQGQAIQLTVDRTQYLDNAASKIQSRLDNELKPIKNNLTQKGNTGGDGSADPSKLRAGATAAVGITITPATPWVRRFPTRG